MKSAKAIVRSEVLGRSSSPVRTATAPAFSTVAKVYANNPMSTTLLIIVTAIYIGVAVNEIRQGNGAACLIFGAYALANVGLILQLR